MTSSSHPPAGWYDDRSRPGFQRWWDGEAWTTHLRTPLPPGQPSQPPRRRPASLQADPTAAPVTVVSGGWRRPQVLVPALVGLITLIGAAVALSPPPDDQVVAGSGIPLSDETSSTIVPPSSTTVATEPATTVVVTQPPTTEPPITSTTMAPTTDAPTTTTRPPTTTASTTRRTTTTAEAVAPATSAAIKPLAGACDPNYTGDCVPVASDVDCAGGTGDGPAYVQGPVTVVGRDIYGLDRDNDGIGCESG